jgi:hypothetical protein
MTPCNRITHKGEILAVAPGGDVVTLVPPHDVHNHGHVLGAGHSPYSLILLNDDMLLFEGEECDPERGCGAALHPVTRAGRTADQPSSRRVPLITM